MSINRLIVRKDKLIKTYPKVNLLDSVQDIKFRVNFINSFISASAPRTKITDIGEAYIYEQERVRFKRKSVFSKYDFHSLVQTLNTFLKYNFVHGDINQKNIKWTENGFKIIDFEPSIMQLKQNKRCLMVTDPYFSTIDLEKGELSSLTDKIGFLFFVTKCLNKVTHRQIKVFSKNRNLKDLIGLNERDLFDMDYNELLLYSINYNQGQNYGKTFYA